MPSGAYYPGLALDLPARDSDRLIFLPESLRIYVCLTVYYCLSYYSLLCFFSRSESLAFTFGGMP